MEKLTKIEKNITERKGATGTSYDVVMTIYSKTYRKSFKTLEEARTYLNELKESRKYIVRKDFEYPQDLIYEIFRDDEDIDIVYIEQNFDENFEYILNTLSEREVLVLDGYYRKGYVLESLSFQLDVTRERVRQILMKALRKIKHPSRRSYLKYGVKVKRLQSGVKELEEELTRLYNEKISIIKELNIKIAGFEEEQKRISDNVLFKEIGELDLTVRTYNCLNRARLKTIGDIVKKTEDDMKKIRNLGKKSLKEIREKLYQFNLDFKKPGVNEDE